MTNAKKYHDELWDIGVNQGEPFAVTNNKICNCLDIKCEQCQFSCSTCYKEKPAWLAAEYVDPAEKIDWTKVPVDTKILVSRDQVYWFKRYFAKYTDGMVYAWFKGGTSWSAESETTSWSYAKLAGKGDI